MVSSVPVSAKMDDVVRDDDEVQHLRKVHLSKAIEIR